MSIITKKNLQTVGRCYARIARIRQSRAEFVNFWGWKRYVATFQTLDRRMVHDNIALIRNIMKDVVPVAVN